MDTLYEIFCGLSIGEEEFDCDSINITESLGEIPIANVSIVPKQRSDLQSIMSIGSKLFERCSVHILVGENSRIFNGYFASPQPMSSQQKISINAPIYGDPFRLSQINFFSANTSGGPRDIVRLGMLTPTQINLVVKTSNAIAGANPFDMFVAICRDTITAISESINVAENVVSDHTFLSAQKKQTITSFQSFYTKIFNEEIEKISSSNIIMGGLSKMQDEMIQNTAMSIRSNPNATILDLMTGLCEIYQLSICTHFGKINILPNFPFAENYKEIDVKKIYSTSVRPIPIKIPTRCIFTTSGLLSNDRKAAAFSVMYPDDTGPTHLERLLGAMRVIEYDTPGITLRETDSEDSIAIQKRLAHAYFAKELLKYRDATISCVYMTDVSVGMHVRFKDPNFGLEYFGFVVGLSHNINVNSVSTDIILKYVYTAEEAEVLGIGDSVVSNPLYDTVNNDILDIE